jgi:FMN-dependent NADH-azoreductase
MKLLHIDSSVLGKESVSRALSTEIVERQKELHPSLEVTYRDVSQNVVSHISISHLSARHGALVEQQALLDDIAKGDSYIDELMDADIIVIGAPMYNFSVSSQLKVWIDRVVVAGRTFKYSATGEIQPLIESAKKVFIASTRGGAYAPGSPQEEFEHHESYLKGIFKFLGLNDVTIIRAEGLAFGPEARDASIGQARNMIAAIAA